MRWIHTLPAAIAMLLPQSANAEWNLREEYNNKELSVISVSADSQDLPVGMRDMTSARLAITCMPSAKNMWFQLIWPEQMTAMRTIQVDRTIAGLPTEPQTWTADSDSGRYQSLALDAQTLDGTELMNRLLTTNAGNLALKPRGNGRIQDAVFDLAGLRAKLAEVTKACPKWSFFDLTADMIK